MEKTRNPGVAASAIPTEVTVSFVNKTEAPIALYWDSGSGQPTKFAEIQTDIAIYSFVRSLDYAAFQCQIGEAIGVYEQAWREIRPATAQGS